MVRNIYGFELDPLRVERLVADYPSVWHQFETQARDFVNWLRALADQLEAGNRTKETLQVTTHSVPIAEQEAPAIVIQPSRGLVSLQLRALQRRRGI